MSDVLEVRQEKRLLRLTLNRPEKRNALNLALCRALVEAIERAEEDASVGAILITGSGKAFCSGMDLSEALEADPKALEEWHERLFTVGYRVRKPIIVGVHGPALAGGTGLAANAHILIASQEASFGLTEIRIGLWPILIFRAVKAAVGERRATELALTGRVFGGREAADYGLVHEVSGEPLARAAEIALQVSQASAEAVRSGLEYVNRARDCGWEEAGRIGWEIRRKAMESEDFKAGVRGFLRKGSPD